MGDFHNEWPRMASEPGAIVQASEKRASEGRASEGRARGRESGERASEGEREASERETLYNVGITYYISNHLRI